MKMSAQERSVLATCESLELVLVPRPGLSLALAANDDGGWGLPGDPQVPHGQRTAIPARGKRAMNCLDGGYSGTLVTCKVYRSLPIQVTMLYYLPFSFFISFSFVFCQLSY
jgi:hypothetical protein